MSLSLSSYVNVVSSDDYVGVSDQIIQFNTGDTNQTHTIIINQDQVCEDDPNKILFSNITLVIGTQVIEVVQFKAIVIVDDELEPECSKCMTNIKHIIY